MAGPSNVVFGGQSILDLTSDTVVPEALLEGYTAHAANGDMIVGTAKGGGSIDIMDRSRMIQIRYNSSYREYQYPNFLSSLRSLDYFFVLYEKTNICNITNGQRIEFYRKPLDWVYIGDNVEDCSYLFYRLSSSFSIAHMPNNLKNLKSMFYHVLSLGNIPSFNITDNMDAGDLFGMFSTALAHSDLTNMFSYINTNYCYTVGGTTYGNASSINVYGNNINLRGFLYYSPLSVNICKFDIGDNSDCAYSLCSDTPFDFYSLYSNRSGTRKTTYGLNICSDINIVGNDILFGPLLMLRDNFYVEKPNSNNSNTIMNVINSRHFENTNININIIGNNFQSPMLSLNTSSDYGFDSCNHIISIYRQRYFDYNARLYYINRGWYDNNKVPSSYNIKIRMNLKNSNIVSTNYWSLFNFQDYHEGVNNNNIRMHCYIDDFYFENSNIMSIFGNSLRGVNIYFNTELFAKDSRISFFSYSLSSYGVNIHMISSNMYLNNCYSSYLMSGVINSKMYFNINNINLYMGNNSTLAYSFYRSYKLFNDIRIYGNNLNLYKSFAESNCNGNQNIYIVGNNVYMGYFFSSCNSGNSNFGHNGGFNIYLSGSDYNFIYFGSSIYDYSYPYNVNIYFSSNDLRNSFMDATNSGGISGSWSYDSSNDRYFGGIADCYNLFLQT